MHIPCIGGNYGCGGGQRDCFSYQNPYIPDKDYEYILRAMDAALAAGKEILNVYNDPFSDFQIERKADNSPLTLADRKAHEIIMTYLQETDYPVLSEEGKHLPYEKRAQWDTLWIVDPLDGTKEFIKRNGEFTVNIALVKEGIPVFGVVYVPVKETLYWGELTCSPASASPLKPCSGEKMATTLNLFSSRMSSRCLSPIIPV